ncbi:uncharacterized protein METZ01_LOCUS353567 [marine metagenome]|uniref:Uncharacterized protein n=1 Tax=marine metagenome TaxID=408172 RepID=A0A382RSP9_9ZZZZ
MLPHPESRAHKYIGLCKELVTHY